MDTSVLIDVFGADEVFGPASREALRQARREGRVVACEVVWAEVAAAFADLEQAARQLTRLEVRFSAASADAALTAGTGWHQYRRRGGPGSRITSEFLVGAHALLHADRLLTRDGGFHRDYFAELALLEPQTRLTRRQPATEPPAE